MDQKEIQKAIESGETALGIEFGSTRIKAVLIGVDHTPIASGSHEWENRYENGIWTYSLEDVWAGLQESYRMLSNEVSEKYQASLQIIGAIGFSGMMHGYLAFDKDGNQLVPFRTWRNTITGEAAEKLTNLFQFNTLEHCASLSGDPEQGAARQGYQPSDHISRLRPLDANRAKSAGRWRSLGHVPH